MNRAAIVGGAAQLSFATHVRTRTSVAVETARHVFTALIATSLGPCLLALRLAMCAVLRLDPIGVFAR